MMKTVDSRHFPLGNGARGRYNTALGNHRLGPFQPSGLTHGNPPSPELRFSNQSGPMEDGTPRTGPDQHRMEVRHG